MKIEITQLPSKQYLAGGDKLNDFAQWEIGKPLKDSDFFVGASFEFRRELRRQLRKAQKRVGKGALDALQHG
jgi:hypothetical protein